MDLYLQSPTVLNCAVHHVDYKADTTPNKRKTDIRVVKKTVRIEERGLERERGHASYSIQQRAG